MITGDIASAHFLIVSEKNALGQNSTSGRGWYTSHIATSNISKKKCGSEKHSIAFRLHRRKSSLVMGRIASRYVKQHMKDVITYWCWHQRVQITRSRNLFDTSHVISIFWELRSFLFSRSTIQTVRFATTGTV
jgi:hypothetical protein